MSPISVSVHNQRIYRCRSLYFCKYRHTDLIHAFVQKDNVFIPRKQSIIVTDQWFYRCFKRSDVGSDSVVLVMLIRTHKIIFYTSRMKICAWCEKALRYLAACYRCSSRECYVFQGKYATSRSYGPYWCRENASFCSGTCKRRRAGSNFILLELEKVI